MRIVWPFVQMKLLRARTVKHCCSQAALALENRHTIHIECSGKDDITLTLPHTDIGNEFMLKLEQECPLAFCAKLTTYYCMQQATVYHNFLSGESDKIYSSMSEIFCKTRCTI